MASPTTTYFAITGDDVIDGLTTGYKWSLDSSRTVDYSISNGFNGEYWINPTFTRTHLGDALNSFAYYANINFSYSGYYATPIVAAAYGSEINLSIDAANTFFSSNNNWAFGLFPASQYLTSPYVGAAGDIYINQRSAANSLPSYEPGSQGGFLLLHELGHTLGLKHPHDSGGTARPTFIELGIGNLDIDWATVMSYNDDAAWNKFSWDPATPMILDVLALQYLYGKNTSTNAGDSRYTIKEYGTYLTLWDASGNDTLDASTAQSAWTIHLPIAAYATLVDTKVGYAMPTSELSTNSPSTLEWLAGDYENVVGTAYDDAIFANQFANSLQGGAGDDTVYGYSGADTLEGGSGHDVLYGGDGADTFDWSSTSRAGADHFYGGAGDDVYVLGTDQTDVVIENANEGNDTVWVAQSYTVAVDSSIEIVRSYAATPITLTGNALSNYFFAGDGADTLLGLGGRDYLSDDATVGSDSLVGGGGADVYVVGSMATSIVEVANTESDLVRTVSLFDGVVEQRLQKFYIAYYGRPSDYDGTAYWKSTLANQLSGSELRMAGYFGNPLQTEFANLYGITTTNPEFLDRVYLNLFNRVADAEGRNYWAGIIQSKVNAGMSTDNARAEVVIQIMDGAQGADAALITTKQNNATELSQAIASVDADNAYGHGNNSTGFAAARDWLSGVGSDTATTTQAQQLSRYVLNEVLGAQAEDHINTSVSYTLPTAVESMSATGNAVITLTGNAENNQLTGNGQGSTLVGGAGSDLFVVNALASTSDRISDFVSGTDLLVLDIASLHLEVGVATVQSNTVSGSNATLLYNTTTGVLAYDADGVGAQTAITLITLVGAPTLALGDVWVI